MQASHLSTLNSILNDLSFMEDNATILHKEGLSLLNQNTHENSAIKTALKDISKFILNVQKIIKDGISIREKALTRFNRLTPFSVSNIFTADKAAKEIAEGGTSLASLKEDYNRLCAITRKIFDDSIHCSSSSSVLNQNISF